jgi:Leucine-rich repeat (LRR) protein
MQGPLLPDSLGTAFFDALARMDSLWFLYLADAGDRGLERIPESLGKLRSLTQLYLMNDSLASLPASIGDLRRLEMLFLRGNRLESLPEGVGALPALKELHVSFNHLAALPEGIYASTTLVTVDIFANRLCNLDAAKKAALRSMGADPDNSGQACP